VFKHYGPQLIFLIFFFLLLELTVVPYLTLFGVRPDLFFILIAFYSFLIHPNRTPHFAVFLGLIRELFSGTLLGLETLSYGISGIMLWFLVMKMERENPYNQAALIFIFSFINLLIISVLNVCLTETSVTMGQIFQMIMGASLYTTLAAPFVFFFIRRVLRVSQKNHYGKRAALK